MQRITKTMAAAVTAAVGLSYLLLSAAAVCVLVAACSQIVFGQTTARSPAEIEAAEKAFGWQELREQLEREGLPPALAARVQAAGNDVDRKLSAKLDRTIGRLQRDVDEARDVSNNVRWTPWMLATLLAAALLAERRRATEREKELREDLRDLRAGRQGAQATNR